MVKGFTYAAALMVLVASVGELHAYPLTPDPRTTTGDLCTRQNPDFKEYRYEERIPYCHRDVSSSTKNRIYAMYGISKKCRSQYTIDHFIPLSIGGSNEEENLWPEHRNLKATRQNLETRLYHEVKAGRLTQDEAIDVIVEEKMNPPDAEPSSC